MEIRTDKTILTQKEAARRLGVSQPTVAQMVLSGQLSAFDNDGRNRFVTAESVQRHLQQRRAPGRPLSPAVALGALYLLSGEEALWLSRMQRSRLRRRFEAIDGKSLAWMTRGRAKRMEVRVRDSLLPGALAFTSGGGLYDSKTADRFNLLTGERSERYIHESKLGELQQRFRAKISNHPTLILHVVPDAAPPEAVAEGHMPIAVCAVDLSESTDPREHAAGILELDRLLDEWRKRQ